MAIKVVRRNRPGSIYIGRGSALGNPFVIGRDGDRNAVCDKYDVYFYQQIAEGNQPIVRMLNELKRLARHGDVLLGCYCAPQRCHGDTIKGYLEDELAPQEVYYNE